MTRLEQQTFINDLMESFKRSMDADFMAGRIPEHWDGRQLRLYISKLVERDAYWDITTWELRDFKNDCLINNL